MIDTLILPSTLSKFTGARHRKGEQLVTSYNRCKVLRASALGIFLSLSSLAHASSLISHDILDTGIAVGSSVSDVDAQAHPATCSWINTTGQTIYIKTAQLFMGMDAGQSGDFLASARRISDNSIVILRGWDHYSAPTSAEAANPLNNFSPDWVLIIPGDGITLTAWVCSVGNQVFFEVGLTIYYTIGAP